MTNKLVAIAGALLLLAGFGPYYALPVHAKASAVYSVDEPGRVPYQSVIFGTTASNCNSSQCLFQFPAVPSGFRLVIKHVSVFSQPKPGATPVRVAVSDSAESGQVNFFATVQGGFLPTLVVIDQPILFYVDAGQNPIVNIQPASGFEITTPTLAQSVNLSGYMVDCSTQPCSAMAP
jgi:hypothetical protein